MFSSHGRIPTQTSATLPAAGCVGLCLRQWWRDILGGCHRSAKEILNHSAICWDDTKRLSSLLSIITFPCSLGVRPTPTPTGHGVTFDTNASVTKASPTCWKSAPVAPINRPYLHARWTRSVFQWYEYIASLFVLSIGTTDIMIKVEALTNFTKQPLVVRTKAIQALNEEQIQMRKR